MHLPNTREQKIFRGIVFVSDEVIWRDDTAEDIWIRMTDIMTMSTIAWHFMQGCVFFSRFAHELPGERNSQDRYGAMSDILVYSQSTQHRNATALYSSV